MDRLISEQAVLDTVFECVDAYDSGEVKESLNMYIQSHIKAIPSAEPKWIPCSEKLPEADGRYLCTYEDDIEENCVDFGSYENGEWYVDKVIAWMPLPTPYEPMESEDKCKNCEYYHNPDYTRCHECETKRSNK